MKLPIVCFVRCTGYNSPLEMIFNPLCAPYYVLTTLRRKFPCNVVVKGESLADTPSFLLEVAIVFQNHSYFPFSWTFKIVKKFIYHCMAGYRSFILHIYNFVTTKNINYFISKKCDIEFIFS